jgi:hypothetical protein
VLVSKDDQITNQIHCKQHPSFSKWEVLEALQSIVVYILLRIIEGRHDYTNFDTQLLASISVSRRGELFLERLAY